MGLSVLLVDDDPLMHRMLAPRLRELPADLSVQHVATALTPEAALAELSRMPAGQLAVVSDFNLKAAMNGLQLLGRVRALRPDSLRVLVSGYSLEQLGDVQAGGDAHAFLEKPLILDELMRALESLFRERLRA
jgi:CheY-like chemotaxis protein